MRRTFFTFNNNDNDSNNRPSEQLQTTKSPLSDTPPYLPTPTTTWHDSTSHLLPKYSKPYFSLDHPAGDTHTPPKGTPRPCKCQALTADDSVPLLFLEKTGNPLSGHWVARGRGRVYDVNTTLLRGKSLISLSLHSRTSYTTSHGSTSHGSDDRVYHFPLGGGSGGLLGVEGRGVRRRRGRVVGIWERNDDGLELALRIAIAGRSMEFLFSPSPFLYFPSLHLLSLPPSSYHQNFSLWASTEVSPFGELGGGGYGLVWKEEIGDERMLFYIVFPDISPASFFCFSLKWVAGERRDVV